MTTNLTKHNCKLSKTLHKWKIIIWTIRYNKTENICTNLYCNHSLLQVILTNKVIWSYLFPEMIRDQGIINIHRAWWPMAWPESGLQETWKDIVTNEHLAKCVKASLIDIRFAKCQNGMETRQCKYCLSFFFNLG